MVGGWEHGGSKGSTLLKMDQHGGRNYSKWWGNRINLLEEGDQNGGREGWTW